MLIDELIELAKNVEEKETFLEYQEEIEELGKEEKTTALNFLKEHNFNKNYLHLLLATKVFDNMFDNLAFINNIVDDENIERVIDILESNDNLFGIKETNWMIKIFEYIKDSNYNNDLLFLIKEHFEIGLDEDAYNEAIAVLDVIQKLNYSKPIIDYFYTRYGIDNIGVECEDINNITMLSAVFDAELFEKQNCIEFYQNEDFAELDLTTQIYIFNTIKNLSDEQKENINFLNNLDCFFINDDLMDDLDDEDFKSIIDCYISLYDEMKEKDSFAIIYDYVNDVILDNEIFQADNINELMRLYNKYIKNDTVTDFLECKDILSNCDGDDLKIMINTIENLDEESLPVKKGEIYDTIVQGCRGTDINPNELFLLLASYKFHPDVLNYICQYDFKTIEEVRNVLSEKTTATLEDAVTKCSDIDDLRNYLSFLKENMNDSETLDLTPKSMVKKREIYTLKTKNEKITPVDKKEN